MKVLAVIGIFGFIVAYAFYGDAIDSALADVKPYIDEYWPFVIPLIGGYYFGDGLYFEYLRKTVILRLDKVDLGMYGAFRVTDWFFSSMKKEGNVCPLSGFTGENLYFCDSVDFDERKVVFSRYHYDESGNPRFAVDCIAHAELFNDLCKSTEELTVENVKLSKAPFLYGLKVGHNLAKDVLDSIGIKYSVEPETPVDKVVESMDKDSNEGGSHDTDT